MSQDKVKMGGYFKMNCYGSDGTLKWSENFHNLLVAAGLNQILNVSLWTTSKDAAWYVGLIKTAIVVADADTLASHAGWTECADYAGNRKAFTSVESTAKSTTNTAAPAVFVMNAGVTVKGAFICSAASGTTGTLLCGAAFSEGDRAVLSGDTLSVSYTLSIADDGV